MLDGRQNLHTDGLNTSIEGVVFAKVIRVGELRFPLFFGITGNNFGRRHFVKVSKNVICISWLRL